MSRMGREAVQETLLQALEQDVQQPFESTDVSLETFRKCDIMKLMQAESKSTRYVAVFIEHCFLQVLKVSASTC